MNICHPIEALQPLLFSCIFISNCIIPITLNPCIKVTQSPRLGAEACMHSCMCKNISQQVIVHWRESYFRCYICPMYQNCSKSQPTPVHTHTHLHTVNCAAERVLVCLPRSPWVISPLRCIYLLVRSQSSCLRRWNPARSSGAGLRIYSHTACCDLKQDKRMASPC